ncbi:MAG: hypothetical protein ACRCU2_01370 [Planktothrix sp.]
MALSVRRSLSQQGTDRLTEPQTKLAPHQNRVALFSREKMAPSFEAIGQLPPRPTA